MVRYGTVVRGIPSKTGKYLIAHSYLILYLWCTGYSTLLGYVGRLAGQS
jgi:hypothetical protein